MNTDTKQLLQPPVVVEKFADNGEHSHWELVNTNTGETLWEECQSLPGNIKVGSLSREDIAKKHLAKHNIIIEGATEEQILAFRQSTYDAMEEYKNQPSSHIATGKHKPFIVANVRDIIDAWWPDVDDSVSFSRMVEMFNEVAEKYYSQSSDKLSYENAKKVHDGTTSNQRPFSLNQIKKLLIKYKKGAITVNEFTETINIIAYQYTKLLAQIFQTQLDQIIIQNTNSQKTDKALSEALTIEAATESLQNSYYKETWENHINSQGEPDIEYVAWLENKIFNYMRNIGARSFTFDNMMDIAGWMAAADPARPVNELKEEALVYISKIPMATDCQTIPSTISEAEKLAFEQFKHVGDDGLFPNHSDKDIWVCGFRDAIMWVNTNSGVAKTTPMQELISFIDTEYEWFLKHSPEYGVVPRIKAKAVELLK